MKTPNRSGSLDSRCERILKDLPPAGFIGPVFESRLTAELWQLCTILVIKRMSRRRLDPVFRQDTADIVGAVTTRLLEKTRKRTPWYHASRGKLTTFLGAVVNNEITTMLRRHSRTRRCLVQLADVSQSIDAKSYSNWRQEQARRIVAERAASVAAAMPSLSPETRHVLRQCAEGVTKKELASDMALSRDALNVLLRWGYRVLRDQAA